MLSTELGGRTLGEPLAREAGFEKVAFVSVGVGGVTNVVGVSTRFDGVAGSEVSKSRVPRCFGVPGRSCLLNVPIGDCRSSNPAAAAGVSSSSSICDGATLGRSLTLLLLLLDALKNPLSPPLPPLPPAPDLNESESADFLRDSVKRSRSLPDGEGLRGGIEVAGKASAVEAGSTMEGMMGSGSGRDTASGEVTGSVPVIAGLVCALISGDE